MQEERLTSEASVCPTSSHGSPFPSISEPLSTTVAKFSAKDRVQGQLPPPPPYFPHPGSFTYGVLPDPNSSTGFAQSSSNNLVMMPNSPASSAAAHAKVPCSSVAFGGVRSELATTSVSQGPANHTAASSTADLGEPIIPTPGLLLSSPHLATPSIPDILAPPGLSVSSTQSLPRPLLPSPPTSSLRPVVPTVPVSPNPTFHPQTFPPPHSMPPTVGNSPQALWPPQAGGYPRPQFLPYAPPVYPVPFSMAPHSMPLAVPLPGLRASGGITGPDPVSYTASGSQQATIQKDVLPPGIERSKGGNDTGKEEVTPSINQVEAWSAHRSDSGAIYYYNAATGESTYEKPMAFKGKQDEAIAQPTPVSWEKLLGTDWSLVTTNDGKNYYYNSKTKISSWQIPLEVAELRKKQEETSKQVDNIILDQNNNVPNKAESGPSNLSAPALNNGGRDAMVLKASNIPGSSTLDLVKKKLQESGYSEADGSKAVEVPAKGLEGENSKDKPKDTNGKGNTSESSSDSEDEDSGPTMEERIMQFREMLKEQEVAPFSKWDKELPKIVFDPRFMAIPSYAERRSLFEHYVRTRAEEVRKEKRAAQKAAVEGFKQLLQDANKDIDERTDYQMFRKKWGHDRRFEALERRDRELLLNERVLQLRKAAVEKSRAVRAAFKSMLQENVDITSSSRWSRVKETLRDDPRYKAVKHEDRDALFNEYINELKAEYDDAERSGKVEEEKLKEREREMRKRKEREEQEMERVKIKVRRKEAVASYQALLVEIIKDPQASWTESRPKLEKDPQRRASNPELDQSDLEKLFRDHMKTLHERCVHDFKALLHEIITPELANQITEDGKTALTSWSTAKDLLRSDHRYTRMARKEREALWRRHVEQIQRLEKTATENKDEKYTDSKKSSVADTGRSKAANQ